MKRMLEGSPIVGGPATVGAFREVTNGGVLLTTSHDGYARQFGVVHQRVVILSEDGTRLDGEDTLLNASNSSTRTR